MSASPKKSFAKQLSTLILRLFGWRLVGAAPDLPKYVLISVPHTSNWDFVMMILLRPALGMKAHWVGKQSIFRWPFAGLMKKLGGIPVDRHRRSNFVDQIVEAYGAHEQLVVGLSPEGTRHRTEFWKTGFYYIACKTELPIALGFMDYGRKEAGFGPLFYPTGDVRADFAVMAAFYADKTGKFPHLKGPIRLREDAENERAAPGEPAAPDKDVPTG